MRVSALDPVGPAIERTTRILFQPFDFSKWLALGLCAWLASLAEGGGGGGGGGGGEGEGNPEEFSLWLEDVRHFLMDNVGPVTLIAGSILLALLLLTILVVWLRARGRFMFIDGVAHNRGAVKEPWRTQREVANRVCVFEVLVAVVFFALMALAVGGGVFLSWADIESGRFGQAAGVGLAFGLILLFLTVLATALISWVLTNFIVPTMYLHGGTVGEAWARVKQEIFAGRMGAILLYLLARIAMGVVLGVLALLIVLCTCCVAALPYVGAVIMLPLSTFSLCYNLCFLEQFGEGWRFYRFALSSGSADPPVDEFGSTAE